MLQRLIKVLHEIGAAGVIGCFAACIVLIATAPIQSPVGYAAVRQGIAAVMRWLLVPSLAAVLVSGLLAIAANRAYANAGWAWVKALLGVSMFEGTLVTVGASARRAADLSAAAAVGRADPAELAQMVHGEWNTLWLLLALSLANVALGVWRPRFRREAVED